MVAPTLTEEDKVRIRHHLGFLNVTEAYSLTFGTPAAIQPQFWIEGAMQRVKVEALPLVRLMLERCDAVEAQMAENTENQAVTKIGNIEINKDEFGQLKDGPLKYWRERLANALGVVPNPFQNGGGNGINVSVG